MKRLLELGFASAFIIACSAPDATGETDAVAAWGTTSTIVKVEGGRLRGKLSGSVVSWRGIPYAAPPVGALRWRPPAPAAPWSGLRDATSFGSACVQGSASGVVGSEDCLFVNVWAPADYEEESLPVIVFVHGGDWIIGSGDSDMYDGRYLAEHGPAVVVTINYRLGALGFMADGALAAEDAHHTTGNYGLLDQMLALDWVHKNIHAFGGDRSRVLLWGQSAGAWSTLMHVASPLGRRFTRAFAESGNTTIRSFSDAITSGTKFAASLGCSGSDPRACLRALPTAKLVGQPPGGFWGPTIDGYVLVEPLMDTFTNGRHHHVPLLIGTTGTEFSYPGMGVDPSVASITSEAAYEAALKKNFGTFASSVLAEYPAGSFKSPRAAYVAAVTDGFMTCPTRRTARAIARSQNEPVWRYFYTHTDASGPLEQYGAGHFMDVPFWFFTFGAAGFTPNRAEKDLANAMTRYLVEFASTGDPNAHLSPWPRYDPTLDSVLQLDDIVTSRNGVHVARCNFWDG